MIEKQILETLYLDKKLSLRQIGLKFNKDHKTISRWFEIYGIQKRDKLNRLPKDQLTRLYLEEMKSTKQIGLLFGCSHEKVRRNLIHFNIPIRNGGEAVKTQWIDNPERRKQQSMFYNENLVKYGPDHSCWNGGIEYNDQGYKFVYCPGHPRAHKNKVREHILVMEKHLGRYLELDEVVHHINEIKDDNRLRNLQLMTNSEHISFHNNLRQWRKTFTYLLYRQAA